MFPLGGNYSTFSCIFLIKCEPPYDIFLGVARNIANVNLIYIS